jgi:hypothetical protein
VAAKVQPPPLSAMSYSLFDVRVLAFSLTISVLTGLLFGVLPFFSIGQVHIFGAAVLAGLWDRAQSVNS